MAQIPEKAIRPFPIPRRIWGPTEHLAAIPDETAESVKRSDNAGGTDQMAGQPFCEIELPAGKEIIGEPVAVRPMVSPSPILTAEQIIASPVALPLRFIDRNNPVQLKLYQMRRIAWDDLTYPRDQARIFYRQAQLMCDFTDDFEQEEPFLAYYPTYQQLTYDQLRTYFTWRTKVRSGCIEETSLSYAYLYIYELLNQVGVADSAAGLTQLLKFWRAYRRYDPEMDRTVLPWIKDYHVYYPQSQTFAEFCRERGLCDDYPTVFAFDSALENKFDLFAAISAYSVKQSIFYKANQDAMRTCFGFVLQVWRRFFAERRRSFEDFLFHQVTHESSWTPFGNAVFYPQARQSDRQIVLSSREIYTCRQNQWTYQTVLLRAQGRQLLGLIFKEMERQLRELARFRHRITVNPDMGDDILWAQLERLQLNPRDLVEEGVKLYQADMARRAVVINWVGLEQIRREARMTQARLTVEDAAEDCAAVNDAPAQAVTTAEPISKARSSAGEAAGIITDSVTGAMPALKMVHDRVAGLSSEWQNLADRLTELERQVLAQILAGRAWSADARSHGVMPEVLMDQINSKAQDCIGDSVLDTTDEMTVFDEYRASLARLLEA